MTRKAKITEQPTPENSYFVYHDHNSHACLEIERKDGIVTYLAITEDGVVVRRAAMEPFEHNYNKLLIDQSPRKACEAFLEYSQYIRISNEALDFIGRIIPNLNKEKYKMPKSQDEIRKDNERMARAQGLHPTPAAKGGKSTGKSSTKTTKTTKPAAAKKSDKPRESASQLFKDLIMEGKLTDDQIFTKVQGKYGLDAKKRGYVAWYRNFLKKAGKNPPDAVEAKK
jgi:hypothetical protein